MSKVVRDKNEIDRKESAQTKIRNIKRERESKLEMDIRERKSEKVSNVLNERKEEREKKGRWLAMLREKEK